ncbi:MAG TPA: ABC transporter ATP-binding protein, partial [Firmicutes bacterium]|nr:ABC transporter ATP-binding protein [Bacillota bacterium]
MRQRVLLAMALACDPAVLIADEPTSSLDAVAKSEILELLTELQRERKFALIVISHEVGTIARLTSRLTIMYRGRVVEEGLTKEVLQNPMHTYTRGLLFSAPALNPYRDLWGIPREITPGMRDGCPFYPRCSQHHPNCATEKPVLEYIAPGRKVACNRQGIVTLLQAAGIHKTYGFQGRRLQACDNCGLEVRAGEVVALIGQSGSGKSTLAGILAGVIDRDAGEVLFQGEEVLRNNATRRKQGIQMVF